MGISPTYHVPALEKGLDILEALASSAAAQTLADLARLLNRTSSEIFRMVDTLERRDYIVREPASGAYRLSLKLYELAHMHSPVESLVRVAAGPMRELSDRVNETCHLSVLHRRELVVVAQAENAGRVRLSVEVGSKAPALHTVSGRLLVAYLAQEESERFLRGDTVYRKMSRAQKAAVRAELEKIRTRACSVAPSEFRTGIDLSVLVGNPAVHVAASLAIPCLAGGVNEGREEKNLLAPMRECAARITAALRLSPPAP